VLYYNKDKLSAPPRNWEELRAAALRLRDGSPRDGKFSAVGDYPFLEALYSAGGSVLGSAGSGLALPEAREALEYTLRFKWDGLSNDRVFGRPDAGFGAFTWGQVGMTVASSDQLPGLGEAKTAYAIAPVPGKGGPVSLLSDYAFVVFSKHAAARKKAIATVLDWLSGAEFQGRAALELGSAPTRESVRATLELEASASGVEAAYSIARVHPFSPLWNSAEMELWRYLGRAYRYQPKPN
jgi:ABC-type glycerol-3-phosphate transport system substrate-binding protein